jgi:hypothetical protein
LRDWVLPSDGNQAIIFSFLIGSAARKVERTPYAIELYFHDTRRTRDRDQNGTAGCGLANFVLVPLRVAAEFAAAVGQHT